MSNSDDLKRYYPAYADSGFLINKDLRNVDFSGLHFRNANFMGSDLSNANLSNASLVDADFNNANLSNANLKNTTLINVNLFNANLYSADLTNANFSTHEMPNFLADYEVFQHKANWHKANFQNANFQNAILNNTILSNLNLISVNFQNANLSNADLSYANLSKADISYANLSNANLNNANLSEANFNNADLRNVDFKHALLIRTNFENANLDNCSIYGISAWNLNLKNSRQLNLIITTQEESTITVDNLEVAQFIYLLLNNEKIRDVIDTITSKVILILGRFSEERKQTLDAIRDELRKDEYDYCPVIFDFSKPNSRSFIETVSTLANMARFIIADLTDAKIVLQELEHIVPKIAVPVVPLLLEGSGREPITLYDLRINHRSLLDTYLYKDPNDLLVSIQEKVIKPAEDMVTELNHRRYF